MDCVVCLLSIFSIFPQMVSSKVAVIKSGVATKWFQVATSQMSGGGSLWHEEKNWYRTCGTGDIADFWLILEHSSFHSSFDLVYVDVEFKLTAADCFARKGGSVPCYSKLFEIYVHYGKTPSKLNEHTLQNIFVFVGNTSNNDGKQRNETFTFPRNNASGVTLAIRSRGACGYVYRLRMYYKYCEEKFINSIKFEKTFSPPAGAVEVFGNCSQNSSASNSEGLLKVYCDSNGTWINNGTIGCSCDAGYEPSAKKGCTACNPGYFKRDISNKKCAKCPMNSLSESDWKSCKCKEKFYSLNETTDCYALLSPPENVNKKEMVAGKVNITWSTPQSTGSLNETIVYEVECYICEGASASCEQSCVGESYDPSARSLTGNFVVVEGLEFGIRYVFRVYAKNRVNGLVSRDKWQYSVVEYGPVQIQHSHNPGSKNKQNLTLYSIVGGIGALILVLVAFLVVVVVWRRKTGQEKIPPLSGFSNLDLSSLRSHPEYIDPTVYERPEDALNEFTSELSPGLIAFETMIGGGEFGDVYKAKMKLPNKSRIQVAVKTLKHDATQKSGKDFLLEASIMGQFNNPNVVRLHGVVTKSNPRMIVLEYMSNGSLDCFLKNNVDNLTQLQLIGMARGVAGGMKYLSTIKFIHRDLAARNILLNDSLLCKISDFGLSRELDSTQEYSTTGGKIPVRWTAPEAIGFRKFTSASDVWSYGILLWEIFSFAERPYWDWDNLMVIAEVDRGYRLPAPMKCPKGVHDLMLHCWEAERIDRPTFGKITIIINKWIRSPETMSNPLDFSLPLEKWLETIKMDTYSDQFTSAGYEKPLQIAALKDEDLKKLGITLIGHRNKILKNAISLKLESPYDSVDV